MSFRICARCERAFYMLEEGQACNYCGHVSFRRNDKTYSSVFADKRADKRTATDVDFTFLLKGMEKKAKLTDYSESGANIIYRGDPVPVNSDLELEVDQVIDKKSGRAVWTRRVSPVKNSTGIRFKGK